jgi:gamma-glutamyl hydrolase
MPRAHLRGALLADGGPGGAHDGSGGAGDGTKRRCWHLSAREVRVAGGAALLAAACVAVLFAGLRSRPPQALPQVRPHAPRSGLLPNARPKIGVMTQPAYGDYARGGDMFLAGSVVNWVRAAGAQVVPVPYTANQTHLRRVFDTLSGLFLPPGPAGAHIAVNERYFGATRFLFQLGLERNRNGSHFPVFGVCWGYELMTEFSTSTTDTSGAVLTPTDAFNLTLPLRLQHPAAGDSRLLKYLTDESYDLLADGFTAIAENMHMLGVNPQLYQELQGLRDTFVILSTNRDRQGVPFVSTIEGANGLPFYGFAWHPERPAWEWSPYEAVPHSPQVVRLMNELALFLVHEASLAIPPRKLAEPDEVYFSQLYTYTSFGCLIFGNEYEMCYYPGTNTPNVTSECFEC